MLKLINRRRDGDEELFALLDGRSRLEADDVLETVTQIVDNVKKNGDSAVLEYTRRFDRVETTGLKIKGGDIERAAGLVDGKLLEVLRRAKKNIEEFHGRQSENSWFAAGEGVSLGQLYRPLAAVGVYVPGGTAPLPSSVLMNVVPAKVAGVGRVAMATPPSRDGGLNPVIAAAALEAGVDEVYLMGGAQAVAALAFGTETVPRVDKIVGPGNVYVNTAKRLVFGYCDIDMFAGPSEIAIIADETANPRFIAADLLSQAEHDPLSASVLVTVSEELAKRVCLEVEKQLDRLPRKEIALKALERFGAAVITGSLEEAVETVNRMAPEHLEVCVSDPFSLLGSIRNAGAIFLGAYSSEPLGDYFAGPNHVLPTSGTARFFSPLGVSDFIKKSSVIYYTREALERVKEDVAAFAEAEGLQAHANAVRVRFE